MESGGHVVLKKNKFLKPENINKENFKLYGDLIDKPLEGNRTDFIAKIQKTDKVKNQSISVIRIEFSEKPIFINIFERHQHTSQAFLPLNVSRYLIAVAPNKNNQPDEQQIKAFIVPGTIGINYYLGTWHSPLQVLDKCGTFAILMFLFESEKDQQWQKIDKLIIRTN